MIWTILTLLLIVITIVVMYGLLQLSVLAYYAETTKNIDSSTINWSRATVLVLMLFILYSFVMVIIAATS